MNRVLGKAFAVVAVGVLATAFTPACAENDQTIFIRAALAPAQNRQNGACLYTSDPTQPTLGEGLIDAAVRDSYMATLLVGNQLVARGDATNLRAESNRVHLNGAVVRVTDPNGGAIGEFTSLATGFLDPQVNNAPSYASVSVVAIDAATMGKISGGVGAGQTKLVVANIKAFGKTTGGDDVESGEYQLPIRVCNGCLIDFPDPAAPNQCPPKPASTGGGGGEATTPCAAGQDEPTPCWMCSDSRPACKSR